MNYLYHFIPDDMQGDILFPLNTLKVKYPQVWAKEVSKYENREDVMQQHIPILDCLWNDVLHLSPVHPALIKKAIFEAGGRKSFNWDCFEIDPHLLNPQNTIVYLYKFKNFMGTFNEDNFVPYDPDTIAQYSVVPQETKDYFKEMLFQGKGPLPFYRVPHILFKGELNVIGIRKISVE